MAARRTRLRARCSRHGSTVTYYQRFKGRILPVDIAVARRSAQLTVPDPRPFHDGLIAATALVHGMTVVTQNVADFAPTGVGLLNPWDA
ncbi:MAG TPA: VapC toxin family PIN domain ribonuclease [Hyphomicrobiaceae bacterium]|nr:VapC toxin family PIN domain ribonuclease [Hyphomicrobiaceae bacterium]